MIAEMQRTIALLVICVVVANAQLQQITLTLANDGLNQIQTRYADPCAQFNLYNTLYPTEALRQEAATQAANPAAGIILPTQQVCSGTPFGWPASSVTLSAPSLNSPPSVFNQATTTEPIIIQGVNFQDFIPVVNSGAPIGTACLTNPGDTACPITCATAQYTAVVTASSATAPNILEFTVFKPATPGAWITNQIELETRPRAICIQLAPTTNFLPYPQAHALTVPFYSGLMWEVERGCNSNTDCAASVAYLPLEPNVATSINSKTTCCGNRCMNANTHLCCSTTTSTRVELTEEKCCNAGRGFTQYLESPCPCVLEISQTASTPVCPTEESYCCLPTKFPEQTGALDCASGNNLLCGQQWGQCYSPLYHRCCNTGQRYDPGSQQCCAINGLQSNNVPCPCGVDSDCWGGDVRDTFGDWDIQKVQVCCHQTAPPLPTIDGAVCSDYTNYPYQTTVNTPATAVRCPGTCIDLRYQICCNGVTCRKEFEKCCNDTCCNLFIGTCQFGYRNFAPNRPNNPREFGIIYEQCTTIQKLDEIKSFWIFVLPASLLLATLGGLALVLVFANKAAVRIFSFIEKTIMGVAIFAALFASLLYFSPAYKYGVVVVTVCIIAIASAAARLKWLNALTLIALGVTLLYIIDPFDGNNYLTFNYLRHEFNGNPRHDTHGLFHLLTRLYPRFDFEELDNICTNWYQGYFRYDFALEDTDRMNNPEVHTFAYCSRGFIVGLLITAAVMLIFLAALFILVLFGLLLRFRKNRMEPIELEIRPEPLLTVPVY